MFACQRRKVGLTGLDAAAVFVQALCSRCFRELGTGAQQDVAGVGLHDRRPGARSGAFHHLEDVEPGGRAHGAHHAAHGQVLGGGDEQLGVAVGRPQAQQAAIASAFGGVGIFPGHLGKVFARAHLVGRLLGAGLPLGHHVGAGVFGHAHQHMGQVDFCRADFAALLLADELVNVAVAHANLGVHLALAHALKQQLVAQLFTETVAVQAFTDQAALQLAHRQAVLLGHGRLGLVDGVVVHLEVHFAGQLQLDLFLNDAFQHLAGDQFA